MVTCCNCLSSAASASLLARTCANADCIMREDAEPERLVPRTVDDCQNEPPFKLVMETLPPTTPTVRVEWSAPIEQLEPSENAKAICEKAGNLVGGDRANQHGDKLQNHQNIADIWNAILRMKGMCAALTALDVANMMEAFKIARRYSGAHNPDDYVDGAGYASIAGEIAAKSVD